MGNHELDNIFDEIFLPKIHLARLSLDQLKKLTTTTNIHPKQHCSASNKHRPPVLSLQSISNKNFTVSPRDSTPPSDERNKNSKLINSWLVRRLPNKRRITRIANDSDADSSIDSSESSFEDSSSDEHVFLKSDKKVFRSLATTEHCLPSNRFKLKHLPPLRRIVSDSDEDAAFDEQENVSVRPNNHENQSHSVDKTAADLYCSSNLNKKLSSSQTFSRPNTHCDCVNLATGRCTSPPGAGGARSVQRQRVTLSVQPYISDIRQAVLEDEIRATDNCGSHQYPFSNCHRKPLAETSKLTGYRTWDKHRLDCSSNRDEKVTYKHCHRHGDEKSQRNGKEKMRVTFEEKWNSVDENLQVSHMDADHTSGSDGESPMSRPIYEKKSEKDVMHQSTVVGCALSVYTFPESMHGSQATRSGGSLSSDYHHHQQELDSRNGRRDSMSCEQQQKQKDRPSSKNKNIFGIFNVPETSSSSSSASVGTVSRLSVDHQLLSLSVTNNSNAAPVTSQPLCSTTSDCRLLQSDVMPHSQPEAANSSSSSFTPKSPNANQDLFHTPLSTSTNLSTNKHKAKLIDRRNRTRVSRQIISQCPDEVSPNSLPLSSDKQREGHVTEGCGSSGAGVLQMGGERMYSILELKYGQLGLPPLIPLPITSSVPLSPSSPPPSLSLTLQLPCGDSPARCNCSNSSGNEGGCSVCQGNTVSSSEETANQHLYLHQQQQQQQQNLPQVPCISPALATDGGRTSPACPTGGSKSEFVIACDSVTLTTSPVVAVVQPWQPDKATNEISFETATDDMSETESQTIDKFTVNNNTNINKVITNECSEGNSVIRVNSSAHSEEKNMKTFLGRCSTIFNFKQKSTPVSTVVNSCDTSSMTRQPTEVWVSTDADKKMTESYVPETGVCDNAAASSRPIVSSSDSSISCTMSVSLSSIVSREDDEENKYCQGQGETEADQRWMSSGKRARHLPITGPAGYHKNGKIRFSTELSDQANTSQTVETVLRATRSLNARNFARAKDGVNCSKFALKECMISALVKREGAPLALTKKALKFFAQLETMRSISVRLLSSKVLTTFNARLSFNDRLTLNRIAQKLFASAKLQKLWRTAACDRMCLPHCADNNKLVTSKASDELFQDVVNKYVQFRNDSCPALDDDVTVDIIPPCCPLGQCTDMGTDCFITERRHKLPVKNKRLEDNLVHNTAKDDTDNEEQTKLTRIDLITTNSDEELLAKTNNSQDKPETNVDPCDGDYEDGTSNVVDMHITDCVSRRLSCVSGDDQCESDKTSTSARLVEALDNQNQSALATDDTENVDNNSERLSIEADGDIEVNVCGDKATVKYIAANDVNSDSSYYHCETRQTCDNFASRVEKTGCEDAIAITPATYLQTNCNIQQSNDRNNSNGGLEEFNFNVERQSPASDISNQVNKLSNDKSDRQNKPVETIHCSDNVETVSSRQHEDAASTRSDVSVNISISHPLPTLLELSTGGNLLDTDKVQSSIIEVPVNVSNETLSISKSDDIMANVTKDVQQVAASEVIDRCRASDATSTCSKSWQCDDDNSSVHTSADTVANQPTVACHVSSSAGSASGGGKSRLHWKKKFVLATVAAREMPTASPTKRPHQRRLEHQHQQQTEDRGTMTATAGLEGSDLSSCARVVSWLGVSAVDGGLLSDAVSGVSMSDYRLQQELYKTVTVQLNNSSEITLPAIAALETKSKTTSLTSSCTISGAVNRYKRSNSSVNSKDAQKKKARKRENNTDDTSNMSEDVEDEDENDEDKNDEDADEGFGEGGKRGVNGKRGGGLKKEGGTAARCGAGSSRGRKKRRANGWSRPKHGGQSASSIAMATTSDDDDNTCVMCLHTYRRNEEWIKCNVCARWMHRHCGRVSNDDWCRYVTDGRRPFTCPRCYSDTSVSAGVRLPFIALTAMAHDSCR